MSPSNRHLGVEELGIVVKLVARWVGCVGALIKGHSGADGVAWDQARRERSERLLIFCYVYNNNGYNRAEQS